MSERLVVVHVTCALRVAVAAALLAVLASGCTTSEDFAAACSAVRRGDARAAVDARLRAVGGVPTFVGEADAWQRETLFAHDACEITFDARDRVTTAFYRDWRD